MSFFIKDENKATFNWWKDNITHEIKEYTGQRHFPTDDQISRTLGHHARDIRRSRATDFFIERLNKQDIDNDRILHVLEKWFSSLLTIQFNDFLVGCRVVSLIGNRTHVDLLMHCLPKVVGDMNEIKLELDSVMYEVHLNKLS